MGGALFEGNKTLSIFKWRIGFNPIHALWVKMPCLPIDLWKPQILKIIGDSLEPISK